jgi:hypothetical protein
VYIGDLEDRHVPAVAASARQVPAGSGVRLHRAHDLEKGVASREHRILETERADTGIVIRVTETEFSLETVRRRFQRLRDEGDLPKTYLLCHHGDTTYGLASQLKVPHSALAGLGKIGVLLAASMLDSHTRPTVSVVEAAGSGDAPL